MLAVGRTAPSSALSWGIRLVTPPASPGHSTAAPRTSSDSGPGCAASSPTITCSGMIPFPVWYNSFYPECQFIWEYVFRVGATDVQSGFHKCWAAYQTYSPWSLKASGGFWKKTKTKTGAPGDGDTLSIYSGGWRENVFTYLLIIPEIRNILYLLFKIIYYWLYYQDTILSS